MSETKIIMKLFHNREGYQCDVPGALLKQAQAEAVSIPLEDGGAVCLSSYRWCDPEKAGADFQDIAEMAFDEGQRYTVRFISRHVMEKYLFAVKVAA